jgi:hypothetical protein
MPQVPKMASQFQKPKSLLWCLEMKSVVTVEKIFCVDSLRTPLMKMSICKQCKLLTESGRICKMKTTSHWS